MAGERVLLLNTSEDVIDALTELLESERYVVTVEYVRHLRNGEVDGAKLLDSVRPDAVIFDLAPPLDENWACFSAFRPLCTARGIPTVLTTTLEQQVRELAGRQVVELLLKPFDLQQLLDLVAVAVGRKDDGSLAARWFPDLHPPAQ